MTSTPQTWPDGSLRELVAARSQLDEAARNARVVVFCGIPGVGKSLLLREQHGRAVQVGRRVSRLQWDIARQAFEIPEVLSRYPEDGGSTHVMIRHAAGLWVRAAIARWHRSRPDPTDMLLIEAPLVGGRFSELAISRGDEAEALLHSAQARFYVPTPTTEVRVAIESARRAEMNANRHARDRANASPQVVDALWREVAETAIRLGLGQAGDAATYSPELYFSLYRAVLRHRRVWRLAIDRIVADQGSPHAFSTTADELAPSPEDVGRSISQSEARGLVSVREHTARWYDT